jgi:N6-adenosine-specific RNA methylase IME4
MMTEAHAGLTKLSHAERLLAEVATVADATQLDSYAEAARVYAKQAKLGTEAINHATHIKVRAQRRLADVVGEGQARGEIATQKDAGRPPKEIPSECEGFSERPATFAELGLDSGRVAEARLLRDAYTEEALAERIEEANQQDRELSRKTLLMEARRLQNKAERQDPGPLPEGIYRVFYADPPWQYKSGGMPQYGSAEVHYPDMGLEELRALPVKEHAANDAVLFLWVTSPMLPDAFPLLEAWGFTYKTSFVWNKARHNYGHYSSVRHEFLLLATRGSCLPENDTLFESIQTIERTLKHSEKPKEFRNIIDTMYPTGARIELFARGALPQAWEAWGNELQPQPGRWLGHRNGQSGTL